MAYPYIVQDLLFGIGATSTAPIGGVYTKLSNRDISINGPQWVADSVIELSRSYPFINLEETGPLVQMTNGVVQYPLTTFLNPGDTIANLVPSFFMYYQQTPPSTTFYNPGITLAYKSIDSLELMLSTPGTPAYWARYGNNIYIAPQPNQNYYTYMRYQKQHPFTNPASLEDVFLLPDEWREIAEYCAALRGAGDFRMLDYQQSYHQQLYGDPKNPGDVGLIASRVTQMQSDMVSNGGLRQIRPVVRR